MASTSGATTTTTTLSVPRTRRRLSTPHSKRPPTFTCGPLPNNLSALDLSSASPTPLLASLRVLVLSHLAELENSLACLDSPISETLRSRGEDTVVEARQCVNDALEMLRRIRDDVSSHLPDLHFDAASVEELLRSHMHDLPGLDDMRSHLPDMPDVRSHLPEFYLSEMRSRIKDVRARFADIPLDLNQPLKYLPTLSSHLQSLHTHLTAAQDHLPSIPSTSSIVDLLDSLLTSNLIPDALQSFDNGHESKLEKAARDVTEAVKRSLNGSKLVTYFDLPKDWQNNPFVVRGYRFIPLNRWPLIILSLFALHNETLNIHTHMIPFLLPFFRYQGFTTDLAELVFMSFAQLCLFCSALWHTMAGCAHRGGMEFCARVDYIGIGWLISASVGTVVYYSFACHPDAINIYLSISFLSGLVGSIFPFMQWFNDRKYRKWRVLFFLGMAFTAIAPMAHLSWAYSVSQVLKYISPILPSLMSYIIGLCFYISHVPERFLSGRERWSRLSDWLGGGSHAIWHAFIVLAIYQHKWAMAELRQGLTGENCLA